MAAGDWTIGIDVGGTKMLAVAVPVERSEHPSVWSETAPKLVTVKVATPDDPAGIVAAAAMAVDSVAVQLGAGAVVKGIGLGLPGFIGLDGVARQAPNLPAIVGHDVAGALQHRVGSAVRADNDANCAAWAAATIDAAGSSTVVAITLGTGIGGGLVVDGRLVRGAHGFAGEPGHMIVDPNGPGCVCGQFGCWEVWASGSGLARLARVAIDSGEAPQLANLDASTEGGIDSPTVMQRAAEGHGEAVAVLDRYGFWVALGLVNLVNLLDPDVVVLSGGIVAEGDALLSVIRREVGRFATMQRGRVLDLRISTVGPAAGAIGAALLAAEDLRVRNPGQ